MIIPEGPILVVEDIAHVRELIEVTLRFKGYPVITASNGQDALKQIANERPALVITDVLMPILDGFALAYRLRRDDQTRDIPIIFLSATYISPEDKEFALRLGAVHFMEKPVDTEEFLLTVAEILTHGIPTLPAPLDQQVFYHGYRERLEDKLRHKHHQITRIESLLEQISAEQQPTFETLLKEARSHREQIKQELDRIYRLLEENGDESLPA